MKKKHTIKVKHLETIESQMIRLGLNRTLLQRAADLSEPTVRAILDNDNVLNITPRTAYKFCKALDVNFDDIFEVV